MKKIFISFLVVLAIALGIGIYIYTAPVTITHPKHPLILKLPAKYSICAKNTYPTIDSTYGSSRYFKEDTCDVFHKGRSLIKDKKSPLYRELRISIKDKRTPYELHGGEFNTRLIADTTVEYIEIFKERKNSSTTILDIQAPYKDKYITIIATTTDNTSPANVDYVWKVLKDQLNYQPKN